MYLVSIAEFWDWYTIFRWNREIFGKEKKKEGKKENGNCLLTIRYHLKFLKIFQQYFKHVLWKENYEKILKVYLKQLWNISKSVDWLLVRCKVKANCSFMGAGPVGEVPSVEVFLRDPSPYVREFRRKPRKTQNG